MPAARTIRSGIELAPVAASGVGGRRRRRFHLLSWRGYLDLCWIGSLERLRIDPGGADRHHRVVDDRRARIRRLDDVAHRQPQIGVAERLTRRHDRRRFGHLEHPEPVVVDANDLQVDVTRVLAAVRVLNGLADCGDRDTRVVGEREADAGWWRDQRRRRRQGRRRRRRRGRGLGSVVVVECRRSSWFGRGLRFGRRGRRGLGSVVVTSRRRRRSPRNRRRRARARSSPARSCAGSVVVGPSRRRRHGRGSSSLSARSSPARRRGLREVDTREQIVAHDWWKSVCGTGGGSIWKSDPNVPTVGGTNASDPRTPWGARRAGVDDVPSLRRRHCRPITPSSWALLRSQGRTASSAGTGATARAPGG